MKIYRYIIATLFVMVIGTGMFLACEKSESSITNQSIDNKIQKSNYDDYIDSLSIVTGIDIIELSQKQYIIDYNQDITIYLINLESELENIDDTIINNENYLFWHDLYLKANENESNMDSLLFYYQIFSCISYDNEYLNSNSYNGTTYMLANDMTLNLQNNYNTLYNAISQDYQDFSSLNYELQMNVIIESLCYGQCEDDLIAARNKAIRKYLLTIGACCWAGVNVPCILCYIVARETLHEKIDVAIRKYQECN